MTTHRHIQLSNLVDLMQVNRIRWYNAARKCAELENKGGMGFYLAKAHKATYILERASRALGRAALAKVEK